MAREPNGSVDARLALIDADLELFLAFEFPTGLRFDEPHAPESTRRLADWFDTRKQRADALTARYGAIIAINDPVGSVVAAERVARIAKSTSDELYTAPIPEPIRAADDTVDAYCDVLMTAAESLDGAVIEAARSCIGLVRQHTTGATDVKRVREIADRAQPCFDELAMRAPEHSPIVREALGDISHLARLHIQLGNPLAGELLARDSAYDRVNAYGVVSRTQDDMRAAEDAYLAAIAHDGSRPEAHYNLGLLYQWRAVRPPSDFADELAHYRKAMSYLEASHARATGAFQREVAEELAGVRKIIAQLDEFLAAR